MNAFDKIIGYSAIKKELRQISDTLKNKDVYAILFIRGERPVRDFKYDILRHPNVAMTTDGKEKPYLHGEVTIEHTTLAMLPMDVTVLPSESYGETNYELLSDEDFEENNNL